MYRVGKRGRRHIGISIVENSVKEIKGCHMSAKTGGKNDSELFTRDLGNSAVGNGIGRCKDRHLAKLVSTPDFLQQSPVLH